MGKKVLNEVMDTYGSYSKDKLNCFDAPTANVLNYMEPQYGNLYIMLDKFCYFFMYDGVNEYFDKIISEVLGINIELIQTHDVNEFHQFIHDNIDAGRPVLMEGNLKYLFYDQHYKKDNWNHLFLINGYDDETDVYYHLDNIHLSNVCDTAHPFFMTGKMAEDLFCFHSADAGEQRALHLRVCSKNENFGKMDKIDICIFLINEYIRMSKSPDYAESQLFMLNELGKMPKEEANLQKINKLESYLLNAYKYMDVYFELMSDVLKQYKCEVEKLDNCRRRLVAFWNKFCMLNMIKIKKDKAGQMAFEKSETIIDLEKEMLVILESCKEYLNQYKEKNEHTIAGSKKENSLYDKVQNDPDNVISGTPDDFTFTFTHNKTYNMWWEDDAPKVVLIEEKNISGLTCKMDVLIEAGYSVEHFQVGIFVRATKGETYFAAIDNQNMMVLDLIGKNNVNSSAIIRDRQTITLKMEDNGLEFWTGEPDNKVCRYLESEDNIFTVGVACKTWGQPGNLKVVCSNISLESQD